MRYTMNKAIRTWMFSTCLMLAGTEGVWGQKVVAHDGTSSFQADVPETVDTIYIEDEEVKQLIVPELQGDVGSLSEYQWYVSWYRINDQNEVQGFGNISKSTNSDLTEADRGNGRTYYWYHDKEGNAAGASVITYKASDNFTGDIVICDISPNTDYNLVRNTFTEPTITKRRKYIIRSASEIKNKLANIGNGGALETFYLTVPDDAKNVNLQMNMTPDNYYWDDSYYQGNKFTYKINNQSSYTSSDKIIPLGNKVDFTKQSTVTVDVSAEYTKGWSNTSPVIARFIITTQGNSGFVKDGQVSGERRNPDDYPKKYVQIGQYDFDVVDSKGGISDSTVKRITQKNNISMTSLPSDETSYGFTDPSMPSVSDFLTPKRDHYGLYRSANLKGISVAQDRYYKTTSYQASTWNSENRGNRKYDWYYTRAYPDDRNNEVYRDKVVYDRTYARTGEYGFFFYVDASVQAGRIAKVKLDGIICENTELTVIVWVADMTNSTNTPPNVNLFLHGMNSETGSSEVLHRFSSGDLDVDPTEHGEWYQLCYNITIDRSKIGLYDEYYLEVQNNAEDSNGADYAIDDIRIYKSLPNIQVQRENACDASTLVISTDYATILRNMGWNEDDLVASEDQFNYDDMQLRKYRYGLMGENHTFLNSVVGNVYFAFLTKDLDDWITVNKNALDVAEYAAMAIRIPVSTVQSLGDGGYEFYTEDPDMAMINEQKMNLRAMNDYNLDVDKWQGQDPDGGHVAIPTDNIGTPGEDDFNEAAYQKAIETLYQRLNIPRLRCPWYNAQEGRLYLAIVNVDDTDLRYRGQTYTDEDGIQRTASGEYNVMCFRASDVALSVSENEEAAVDPKNACSLVSPFTVLPSATILINTQIGDVRTAACAGSLRRITAKLNATDEDGEAVDLETLGVGYLFDWYLGDQEAYDQDSIDNGYRSIKAVLENYRSNEKDYDEITLEEAKAWTGGANPADASRLVGLLESGTLLTGSRGGESFDLILPGEHVVAIPYVYSGEETLGQYEYCSDCTQLTMEISATDVPTLATGFPNVSYPFENGESSPLRLGQRHLRNTMTLQIPVASHGLKMAEGADHLGISVVGETYPELYFRPTSTSGNLIAVGTVRELNIPRTYGNDPATVSNVTIQWNEAAQTHLQEGQQYELLFPFVQYKSDGEVLSTECDGLASLPVKIVPEYLTWKGGVTDKWFDEDKWNQSTKGELYFSGPSEQDANGNDAVTNAYAPLYFTKITLPESSGMVLEEVNYDENGTLTPDVGNTTDIQYDMAVDTVTNATGNGSPYSIVPYYINKVNEIYLKPGATLMNQQCLIYDTARVEFEMTPGTAYWMASPLHDVYAGDMYAPLGNGRQTTPAFNHIVYNTTDYDRWSPAFYQKAWSRAIAYSNVEDPYSGDNAGNCTDVNAVQSNWSIEYNDVWVPYTLGKGFYARVEDMNGAGEALVRLPKADTEYLYEKAPATRSLSQKPNSTSGNRTKAGKMADGEDIEVELSAVDGDGKHFLIGNPYMTYLDMSKFFAENTTLARKYWTLSGGTSQAVVGTPDVGWEGNETGSGETLTGLIPPMTAFFVELNDDGTTRTEGTTQNVTFTTDMMAQAPAAEAGTTRAYTASNPVLTLTAEREGYRSVATLMTSDKASDGYEASEDAVVLLDSELDAPMVYTVSGSVAAQVNAVKEISNVGLGVYNGNGDETTITISGINQLAAPLYLYDARTRESVVLEGESYDLRVSGDCHGRYYLRSSVLEEGLENNISIYSARKGEVIVSALRPVKEIKVFGVNGRQIRNISVNTTQYQFTLPSGLYIICASDGDRELTEKVIVR